MTNPLANLNGASASNHAAVNGLSVEVYSTTNGYHDMSNGVPTPDAYIKGSQPVPNHIETPQAPPIAICGMAVRLPAGLKTPQQLWEFLLAGGDARSKVPESRYNISSFYDPSGKPGTTLTEYGYFLDDDLSNLDTSFWSMARKEVERVDPQQRLLLEVTREAFEDAGETGWRGKKIGCYVGTLNEDWSEMFARETQNWDMYRITGYGDFCLSNRISYEMDLQGPSVTVRTACSASMTALHEASVAIGRGDCDAAIVGGANLIMTAGCTTAMTEQGILSKDGSCKSFSIEADGYGRGEAITAIFIKRLDDALRDGNSIRAVIRATAANHDGKTPGFSLPSAAAQETLIRRAYKLAGITDYTETGYVECHGTGTKVGDPIETTAVANVFREAGVYIGSTKPNLGHTEGASGVLSVIKTVLTLENRTIPPNIKFTPLNPAIPFESGKLTLVGEPTPWPEGRLGRASVNSFGLGGSNAHVIIDSTENFAPPEEPIEDEGGPHLLLYSANTPQSLNKLADTYKEFVKTGAPNVKNVAYTLANGREHLPYRAFSIAKEGQLGPVSQVTKSGKALKVVLVFTGQGAQWAQMGKDLMHSNPTFSASIRLLDKHLQALGDRSPDWTIEGELRKPAKKSRVNVAEFSQPLCTAIQIGLVDILKSLGIQTHAVVGHSSGEIGAAYAAGALDASEAIVVALYRGVMANKVTRSGAMAAIGMSWADTEKFLVPNTGIACDNSPRSVTISGDAEKVEAVLAGVRESRPDILARKLLVDKAYHSHHMADIGEQYRAAIAPRITAKPPNTLFFSSVTGHLLDDTSTLDAHYWQENLESPVLFQGAVSGILQHFSGEDSVFVEVGPHSALAGPLTQILTEKQNNSRYVPTMVRNQNCIESLLSAVGKLYTFHVPINLRALFPSGSCIPDLPRYPWNHEESSYWFESRLSKEYRQRKHPLHDLLGTKTLESTDLEPAWRNLLHLQHTPWLRDHKVGEDIVFPFAGYVSMAGEAIRQVTGIDKSFHLRNVHVGLALLLSEEKPTEIITNFRPVRLTESTLSKWWEFTIAAYNNNNNVWTKHCTGEVTAQSESPRLGQSHEPFSRAVDINQWFDAVRRAGLDLGPEFENLQEVTADTTKKQARGRLISSNHPSGSKYHIHPAVFDSCLQMFAISFSNGLGRKHRNFLPTFLQHLSVVRTASDIVMNVETNSTGGTSIVGGGAGIADGNVVLSLAGLKLTPVDNSGTTENLDTHAAARLTWGPDINFVDMKSLFKPSPDNSLYGADLEELGKLCILHANKRLVKLNSQSSRMSNHQSWIREQAASFNSSSIGELEDAKIPEKINSLLRYLADTPADAAATALHAVASNIEAVVVGQIPFWEALLPGETVTKFHDFVSQIDCSAFFRTAGHSKPNLRVLEINSRRRSPSPNILEALTLESGRYLWSQYTFASKSLIPNEERTTTYPNLDFFTLDIAADLSEQGFGKEQYDVVILNDLVYSKEILGSALNNIRKLMHSSGHLFLQDISPDCVWLKFILGTLPQQEYDDFNKQWQDELASAGYGEVNSVTPDLGVSSQPSRVMIGRPSRSLASKEATKNVTILCHDKKSDIGLIRQELERQGYEVTTCTINDDPPPRYDVISVLELDGPFLDDLNAASFRAFQDFVRSLSDSGIFWITKPSQIHCQDPRYAQFIGTARTIRTEVDVDFATCEVEDIAASITEIAKAFVQFNTRGGDDSLKPDFEYSITKNGAVNVGRYFPFVLQDEANEKDISESERYKIEIDVPGRLNTLHWTRQSEPTSLGPDEVEIEMHSVGLNFKDILIAMNLVELPGRILGLEGSGIVRRIGSNVNSLRIGDRVATMSHFALTTLLVTEEIRCVRIPNDLSFSAAATLLTPFATALHSVMTVGDLRKGQSILIHSACGGVGLAAVQLARMVQAEIFATVGSEDKVQYLVKTFNIPRSHIFNSRNESFAEGLMRETKGEGVDLVLNSLSGELLHASWRCVAPFGKFVEIGKRDLIGLGKLDMDVFLANRSYCCVDIDGFYFSQKWRFQEWMRTTIDYVRRGLVAPIVQAKEFEAASVADAFRYMQPGQHIGRVSVSMRDSLGKINLGGTIMNSRRTLSLDPSASYLLIGGLGGLGRSISTWMVEHGARNLMYMSRSAGRNPSDAELINELKSMGCSAQVIQGNVTNPEDVTRVVQQAKIPIKGVLQMSMVYRGENFFKMSIEDWNECCSPKVQGTWNLHQATAGLDLDFFVLFSSMSATIGQPGMANYAGANTFLNAFVQYRNNLGLAASSIDIGPVTGIGYLSSRLDLLHNASITGFKKLVEQEVLDALEVSILSKKAVGVDESNPYFADQNTFVLGLQSSVPLNHPSSRAVWKKDRRMAIYHNTSGGATTDTTTSSTGLKSYIAAAKADTSILKTTEASSTFAREIGKHLFDILLKSEQDLNTSLALAELGLDSLVAIELRTWWKQVFGFDISVLEMLGMGNLESLGQYVADRLLQTTLAERGETNGR